MEFSRQEYWSGLPFSFPGDLPDPGIKATSDELARGFFITEPPGKSPEVKNLLTNARDTRDTGSIPGSGRSPGKEHGNALQYSCLKNPKDRGARWDVVHRVAKS